MVKNKEETRRDETRRDDPGFLNLGEVVWITMFTEACC